MTPEQYLSVINRYNEIITSVSGLYSYLENCDNIIKKCKPLVDETIIDGDPIDKGMLTNIKSSLEQLRSSLDGVVRECNSKIDTYRSLYRISLIKKENLKGRRTEIY